MAQPKAIGRGFPLGVDRCLKFMRQAQTKEQVMQRNVKRKGRVEVKFNIFFYSDFTLMFAEADKNNDGFIDFDEFVMMMLPSTGAAANQLL
jgi:hypothetical protein